MQNGVPHRQTRWRRMTAAAIPSPSTWTTAGPSCQAGSATFWCGASPLPQLDPGRSSDRGFSYGQRSTLPDPFVNAPPCADDDVKYPSLTSLFSEPNTRHNYRCGQAFGSRSGSADDPVV